MSTQTGSEELNESVPHGGCPSSEERGCPRITRAQWVCPSCSEELKEAVPKLRGARLSQDSHALWYSLDNGEPCGRQATWNSESGGLRLLGLVFGLKTLYEHWLSDWPGGTGGSDRRYRRTWGRLMNCHVIVTPKVSTENNLILELVFLIYLVSNWIIVKTL